ncbi:MAG: hypothetical protein U1G08_17635 [Verrucomicrobiota bacterium]
MNLLLHWIGRAVIAWVQLFPLTWVARVGRFIGALAWRVDRRHRRVAISNLTAVFGSERTAKELRVIARENYIRLVENYLSLLKIGGMSDAEIAPHMEWHGVERLHRPDGRAGVLVIGHFGNFELFTRLPSQLPPDMPPQKFASTYRALRPPALSDLMQSLRHREGILFFERRTGAEALKQTLSDGKTWLALLADQHAGDRGLWLPFLGRECSCSASPAVFALRARHPLITAVCYRTGLARWRWEFGDWIPDSENGRRRSVEAITRDINAVFEAAIRRDPANWFWVHRRWKPPSPHQVPQSSRSPASSGAPVQKAPVSGSSSDSLTS